jgi:hypothetical protein
MLYECNLSLSPVPLPSPPTGDDYRDLAQKIRHVAAQTADQSFATGDRDPISSPMQLLDLTDDEAAALTVELHDIVENDRYPFSPRINTLRAILAKLRPEPVRKPLPPLKVYAPPSKGRYKRRG